MSYVVVAPDKSAALTSQPFGRSASGGEELPVPLGDDFDVAVGHLDGGLVVDRVRRRRYPRGPLFCNGHVLVIGVVHVRNNRKIRQSESLSLDQDHAEIA